MEHYFTNSNNLKSEIKEFKVKLSFFKRRIGYGTYLLLTNVLKLNIKGNVLDLGCGYGALGIVLAKLNDVKVTMIDVNKRALHLTKMNAHNNEVQVQVFESDGVSTIQDDFDYIVTNPPIRVGKIKLYELISDALKCLKKNGELFLVIRKEQGAKSFINDFSEKAQIKIIDKNKGFYILSLKVSTN